MESPESPNHEPSVTQGVPSPPQDMSSLTYGNEPLHQTFHTNTDNAAKGESNGDVQLVAPTDYMNGSHASDTSRHVEAQFPSVHYEIPPKATGEMPQLTAEERQLYHDMEQYLQKHAYELRPQRQPGVEVEHMKTSIYRVMNTLRRSIGVKKDLKLREAGDQVRGERRFGYAHNHIRHLLNEKYYSSSSSGESEEDDTEADEDHAEMIEELKMKRRELARSMQMNMELVTEELIEIRLENKLRKARRKEAKREANREASEREAAEREAAKREAAKREAAKREAAKQADVDSDGFSDESNSDNSISTVPPVFMVERRVFAKPEIDLVDWTSFVSSRKLHHGSSFVIEVLVGEPAADETFMGGWWAKSRRHKNLVSSTMILSNLPNGQYPLPERIRIKSRPILGILEKIIDPKNETSIDLSWDSVVFLRPFKALSYYQEKLRHHLRDIRENLDKPQASAEATLNEENVGMPRDGPGTDGSVEKVFSEDDAAAMKHLECLLEFFDKYVGSRVTYLKSPECKKVHFSDLWYLYRPGMMVIGGNGKQAYRVLRVTSAGHQPSSPYTQYYYAPIIKRSRRGDEDDEKKRKPQPDFCITCSYIDFDGKSIGPVLRTFETKKFEGERAVESLEVYPIRFHKLRKGDFAETDWKKLEAYPEEDRCRRYLVQRGRKFVQTAGVKHMYYSGPTMVEVEHVESQVVIDFETAFAARDETQEHIKRPSLESVLGEATDYSSSERSSSLTCACCAHENVYEDSFVDKHHRNEHIDQQMSLSTDINQDAPSVALFPQSFNDRRKSSRLESIFSDEELIIMSYRVFGFVLRSRKWAQLDLSYLNYLGESKPITPVAERGEAKSEQDKTAFDQLVLEKGHREMIVSLITQHFRDRDRNGAQNEQVDIVRGKGKGLILLLHGAPGVGKTSTAEGVAELFQKPLFQITCGDLGVTAKEVEKTLETNFNLATKWGCILLLDEADVFLAERDKEDFVRNGLVAAFLRVLEYYAGILFLTTNRIGDFDEAFTSRIHMSLYYPELDQAKTLKIFRLNIALIRDRFFRKKCEIDIDDDGIMRFAKMHFLFDDSRWNGRQIRNACQTALALAEYQSQKNSEDAPNAKIALTVENFEMVRKAYLEFTLYLNELYGTTSSRRAKENKIRAEEAFMTKRELFKPTSELYKTYQAFLRSHEASLAGSQNAKAPQEFHSTQQAYRDLPLRQTANFQSYPSPQTTDRSNRIESSSMPVFQRTDNSDYRLSSLISQPANRQQPPSMAPGIQMSPHPEERPRSVSRDLGGPGFTQTILPQQGEPLPPPRETRQQPNYSDEATSSMMPVTPEQLYQFEQRQRMQNRFPPQ